MYEGAHVLLGTATPSMESFYNASTGKYGYVKLTTRFRDVALPEIRVVDVKDLYRRKMMKGPFGVDLRLWWNVVCAVGCRNARTVTCH